MHIKRLFRFALLALLPVVGAGCEEPSGGGRLVPGEDLVFLRPAPDAPPLAFQQVSFVAVAGEDHEVRIDYENGDECLRFRLDDDALTRRPNGTRMNDGDTITITIRVVDNGYFNFEFQPAGLRFAEPAELRVNYQFAHPDFNGDGEVDDDDADFDFGWWRQEMPGQPWQKMASARVHDSTEVRADIHGFTRYALAGGT
ncbi:MAG TPA: hypothetical protein VEQ60_21100 [Longimicrobium sp.]|nr:hypothetical protein [Longimicrobium sp.]